MLVSNRLGGWFFLFQQFQLDHYSFLAYLKLLSLSHACCDHKNISFSHHLIVYFIVSFTTPEILYSHYFHSTVIASLISHIWISLSLLAVICNIDNKPPGYCGFAKIFQLSLPDVSICLFFC